MRTTSTLFGLLAAIAALPAMAQDNLEIIGKPIDGKMGFQPAATGQSEGLQSLDFGLLIVITLMPSITNQLKNSLKIAEQRFKDTRELMAARELEISFQ